MTKERLSKLQKWIITECFKVTVLLDRSGLKELKDLRSVQNHCRNKDNISKERNHRNTILYYCNECKSNTKYYFFYRDDILLSYFNLTPDNWKVTLQRMQHFKGSKKNNKAYVSLGRSLNNLTEKGYINTADDFSDGMIITLTDKGHEQALELLNIDASAIDEPPLLDAEEQANEKEKSMKILESFTNF